MQDEVFHPRGRTAFTILQINDVYSTVPVDGLGGLARVATLKKQFTDAKRNPLLMIGGDFLSSSVASTFFKGEQMIDALNAAGLDVAAFGNHEFDFGVDLLLTRMKQAKWQWVNANIVDRQTSKLLADTPPYVIRTIAGLKVGIIGLCIIQESMRSPALRARLDLLDPIEAAGRYVPQMKRDGADVIVALTHLNFADDRELAIRYPDIDVIVGGHEHYPITAIEGRTLISKAGSEARYVARIDIGKRDTVVERFFEMIPVNASVPEDPAAAAIINGWEAKLGSEMDDPVGSTTVPLDARDLRLRASEANIGNLVADAIRREADADIGLLNAGGIRGNREFPAGTLTHRDLLQIHPFGNRVCKIEITGALLLQALNHGVARLPATDGRFPQVSNITFHVDTSAPVGNRVRDLRVGGVPIDLTRTYTVALPDYLLNGGDGYEMLIGSRTLIGAESGTLMEEALGKALTSGPVSPKVEGRIIIDR
ncbi:MAG: 5'-nucleotidase C-terminal domain-containing protein [Vicinamibacterales bacterium]